MVNPYTVMDMSHMLHTYNINHSYGPTAYSVQDAQCQMIEIHTVQELRLRAALATVSRSVLNPSQLSLSMSTWH